MKVTEHVIIPDIHVPFHDEAFVNVCTKVIKMIQPASVVQLGDALDWWQISDYDKDPTRKNNIAKDVELYMDILEQWFDAMPVNSTFHQLEGNHEDRLRRFVWRKARELHSIVPDLPSLMEIDSWKTTYGVKGVWHPMHQYDSCQIGDVILHHGSYFSKHVAAKNLEVFKKKNISGHTHRVQEFHDATNWSVSLGHGALEEAIRHRPTPNEHKQTFGILTVANGQGFLDRANFLAPGVAMIRGQVIKG